MGDFLIQITNYLTTQSWQIAILVAVITAINWTLKNKSAHVRYLLWLIVLTKCLMPPLLTVPLAILPEERPTIPLETPDIAIAVEESIAVVTSSEPTPGHPAPIVFEQKTALNVRQWLGIVWIAGAIIFVLVAVIKALKTELWLKQQRKLLPVNLHSLIENLFSGIGLKNFPKVWLVDGIGQPFVWGILRGSIYLPADFAELKNAEHQKGILGHELSHILRFDAAVNLLQVVAQAIFWFHPFVWWANKRIRAEREKCCGEMAIARLGTQAKDYSKAIVNILICEQESTRPVPSLAVAGPVKNIEERIRTMMRPGRRFYKSPSLAAVFAVLVFALVTVPTALIVSARGQIDAKTEAEEKSVAAEKEKEPAKSLFEAVEYGDVQQIKAFLSKGVKDEKKNNAFSHAVTCGQLEAVKVLLEAGADIEHRDRAGFTRLHWAIWVEPVETVELLIRLGAHIGTKTADGKSSVDLVMSSMYPARQDVMKLLVKNGVKISNIQMAAYLGDLEDVKRFLADGVDINSRDATGKTALHAASATGEQGLAEYLIKHGAEVDAQDNNGYTPLHEAVYRTGSVSLVSLLISNGAKVNAESKWGPTTLALIPAGTFIYGGMGNGLMYHRMSGEHEAEMWHEQEGEIKSFWDNREDMLRFLLEKGGDPRKSNLNPVLLAAGLGLNEWVQILIDRGVDIDANDVGGMTALHYAACAGKAWTAEWLVKRGADVNVADRRGWTPLHFAALSGQRGLVGLLLGAGANAAAKNNKGEIPLSLAEKRGYQEIVELLRKHGAKE